MEQFLLHLFQTHHQFAPHSRIGDTWTGVNGRGFRRGRMVERVSWPPPNNSLLNSKSVFIFFIPYIILNTRMKSNLPDLEGEIVLKNYKIVQKIGAGAFGEIYKAQNQAINNQFLAVKVQPIKSRFPQLLFQARLLQHIHAQGVKEGIPQVHGLGMENGNNIMLMDLLGNSLDYHFTQSGKKFSLQTVLKIGIQLLNRIQILHERGFLHRDIKPDNMMVGLNDKSSMIYLIDLGLSKRFMIEQDVHIPMKKGNQLIGTLRYASISNHKGFEQGRRDDVQSIGYVLAYFLVGSLPWQSIKANCVKDKIQMIKNKKISTPAQKICPSHSNLPKFIKYSRELKFDEKPNYEYLRKLLQQAAQLNKIQLEGNFDWEKPSSLELHNQ